MAGSRARDGRIPVGRPWYKNKSSSLKDTSGSTSSDFFLAFLDLPLGGIMLKCHKTKLLQTSLALLPAGLRGTDGTHR